MSSPLRGSSFRRSSRYFEVLWLSGRTSQDFSFNEMQAMQDADRIFVASNIFRDGSMIVMPSIESGTNPLAGTLVVGNGTAAGSLAGMYFSGRVYEIPSDDGAQIPTVLPFPQARFTLNFPPAASSPYPTETIYVRYLTQQVTYIQDDTLVNPVNLRPVDERIQFLTTFRTSDPDALNEGFDSWPAYTGPPSGWNLVSGSVNAGEPAKFGFECLQLNNAPSVDTVLSQAIALKQNTQYFVYFWVKTVYGQTNLAALDGAKVSISRVSGGSPGVAFTFPTTGGDTLVGDFVLQGFSFLSDGNTAPVIVTITLPGTAPQTQVLLDALLITSEALNNSITLLDPTAPTQLDRAFIPVILWDRQNNVLTPINTPRSVLNLNDFAGSLTPPRGGLGTATVPTGGEVPVGDGFGDYQPSPPQYSRGVIYGSEGTYTFTVPAGVYKLKLRAWGAGAGGGGGDVGSPDYVGPSGAGGGYVEEYLDVNPGDTLTVIVGMGGPGNAPGGYGNDGGDTTVQYATTFLTAGGGKAVTTPGSAGSRGGGGSLHPSATSGYVLFGEPGQPQTTITATNFGWAGLPGGSSGKGGGQTNLPLVGGIGGNAATGSGSGGAGGGYSPVGPTAFAGGNGGDGKVVINW